MNVGRQFGENLKVARKRAMLSQEELGMRATLHRTEIGLLERGGRIPRIDTLIKLATALGTPPAELIDGIEWKLGASHKGDFMFRARNEEVAE